MNICFEAQSVRFRVNQNEFSKLINQKKFIDYIQMPDGQKIESSINIVDRRSQDIKFLVRDNCWILEIPESSIEGIQNQSSNKQNLTSEQFVIDGNEPKSIVIVFELDSKKK